MSKKLMLLALAAVSAAMFALPAVASAGTWTVSTPEKFTVHGNTTILTQQNSSLKVTCTAVTGSGTYTSGSTGTAVLTFHGCKESVVGSTCTGEQSEPSGTIKTTNLTVHNIMLEGTPGGIPGVVLKPASSPHFASFTCLGITYEVTGNGIVGEVERACGTSSTATPVDFASPATGVQKWMQETTAGTKYDLDVRQGSTVNTASMDGTGTVTTPKAQTINCP